MDKMEFFKNAIDKLREWERGNTSAEMSAESLRYFDRFIRNEIFGGNKIELTAEERDELQDYYILTL